jgi:hypothetical protein
MIGGVALIAVVVAFLALRGGGADNPGPSASSGGSSGTLSTPGECGEGKPDPSYTVSVTSDPNPPRPDGTIFHLAVRHNGAPVTGAKVCLGADMPDMQHPGVGTVAKETTGGVYDEDLKFSMVGSWVASVTIVEPGKDPALVTMVFQVTQ